MTNEQRAFFEDLAQSVDSATNSVGEALAGRVPAGLEQLTPELATLADQLDEVGRSAVVSIVRDAVTTALHSAMVTIDGGSSSAETVVVAGSTSTMASRSSHRAATTSSLSNTSSRLAKSTDAHARVSVAPVCPLRVNLNSPDRRNLYATASIHGSNDGSSP